MRFCISQSECMEIFFFFMYQEQLINKRQDLVAVTVILAWKVDE